MGSHSSISSTETSPSTWRRSKPTRAAWSSFVTRCDGRLRRPRGEAPKRSTDYRSGGAGMRARCRVGTVLLALLAFAAGESRLRARQVGWQPEPGHTQVPIWPGGIPDAGPVDGPEVAGTVVDSACNKQLIGG